MRATAPSDFRCTEQHSRDASARVLTADFPQAVAERTAQWHPDRPGKLHVFDVLADDLPLGIIQRLQPIAHWLSAGWQCVEKGR
jgi:hypothetical protein